MVVSLDSRLNGMMSVRLRQFSAASAIVASMTVSAYAACPIELAVYEEADTGSAVEFQPGETGVVSNVFHMVLPNEVTLGGVVMWTDDPARPLGMLTHNCPEGDVTGDEIADCTAWEGVIYTADESGSIRLLPPEGTDAPQTLIFADLARGMRFSPAIDAIGLDDVPWDVFVLSGCQE